MFSKLLENLSIPRQMYLLTGMGILSIIGVIAGIILFAENTNQMYVSGGVGIATMLFVATIMGRHAARRTEKIIAALHALSEGDLVHKCAIPGKDEFAWMSWEYSCARKAFNKMINETREHTMQLASASEQLASITDNSKRNLNQQNAQTEQVATAMNEMVVTIQEVARSAASAAESANSADTEAATGNQVMTESITSINTLAQEVQRTFDFITKLKEESDSIGAVLDVIRGIAEQTNLLALNAAIEAARAGEQGRGFAVVADEVRTLASRTQESTQEIQDMIERLQAGANDAVTVMQEGRNRADISVGQSAEAGKALQGIASVVDNIKSMNMHIATAAEEQSATADEINRNIVNISSSANETTSGAEQSAQAAEELSHLATQLQDIVQRFKVA